LFFMPCFRGRGCPLPCRGVLNLQVATDTIAFPLAKQDVTVEHHHRAPVIPDSMIAHAAGVTARTPLP
jgi:hypothetical protein